MLYTIKGSVSRPEIPFLTMVCVDYLQWNCADSGSERDRDGSALSLQKLKKGDNAAVMQKIGSEFPSISAYEYPHHRI